MDAAIYWEPDGGAMRKISLGCTSDFEPIDLVERADVKTYSGRTYRKAISTGLRVKVGIEVFAGGQVERDLRTIMSHLAKGGAIGYAADSSKAWCGYARTMPLAGDTTIKTGRNVWHGQATSTLASGDELALESFNDTFKREIIVCDEAVGITEKDVDVASEVQYGHAGTAWLRHRLYLPVCFAPIEFLREPPVTSRNRRIFRWDLTLDFMPETMAALYAIDNSRFGLGGLVTSQPAGGVLSQRDLLREIEAYNGGIKRSPHGTGKLGG